MDEKVEQTVPSEDLENEARRDFLKKVGKASATAPAVGLLLAASLKSDRAQAGDTTGGCGSSPVSGGCGSSI